jgi:hypothetical protein
MTARLPSDLAAVRAAAWVPGAPPITIAQYAELEKSRGAKLVLVYIPKRLQHRLDDNSMVDVLPGRRRVPEALAGHWWFRANGVKRR